MTFTIAELGDESDLTSVRTLFRHYADWLERDFGIAAETHGIDAEIIKLPDPYLSPDGALIGAKTPDGSHVGCIALRRLDHQSCEVKRLFVLPEVRGQGLGEALVAALIETARALGYTEIILDVGDYQRPARALYARCGFREIPQKDHISYPGVVFMAYAL